MDRNSEDCLRSIALLGMMLKKTGDYKYSIYSNDFPGEVKPFLSLVMSECSSVEVDPFNLESFSYSKETKKKLSN